MRITIISFALVFLACHGFAAEATTAKDAIKNQDPIVGRWRWDDSKEAFFLHTDGTATQPHRSGKWVCLTPKATPRKYLINWDNGIYYDTLALVKNKTELVGQNQEDKKHRATRLPL